MTRESGCAHNTDVHQQMADMLFGYWISQAIRATADLSIADHLAHGGLTAAEVAKREGSAPDATYRLMRAGVAVGLMTVDGDGRFHTTPLLETLRTDAPRSMRALVMAVTGASHWLPLQQYVLAVRSGKSQAPATLGMDLFEYFEQNPAEAREFSAGMTSITSLWAREVAQAIDTTNMRVAVDVGGANGALLRILQQANPKLHGVVFDRPNIAGDVAIQVAQADFADRTDVVGGDFFKSVPTADLYLLKFVLHDWDDPSCVKILSRCREAMTPGGRIAVIEMIVGDTANPGVAALMDLDMLVANDGGGDRSLAEYDALLAAAGLRRTAVITTGSPQSVIEAVAA